jgi:hypothetical protein
VTDFVWIFFVDARQCKTGETLSSVDVKLSCVLGSSTHREEQERDAEGQFHRTNTLAEDGEQERKTRFVEMGD